MNLNLPYRPLQIKARVPSWFQNEIRLFENLGYQFELRHVTLVGWHKKPRRATQVVMYADKVVPRPNLTKYTFTGLALCSLEDNFDKAIGTQIALTRLFASFYQHRKSVDAILAPAWQDRVYLTRWSDSAIAALDARDPVRRWLASWPTEDQTLANKIIQDWSPPRADEVSAATPEDIRAFRELDEMFLDILLNMDKP